jgi:glycosyltransferase involved in cell wall biosynthesis
VRVAWLGHRSVTGADGLITYSRQITAGLRERGVDVLFLHHSRELDDGATDDEDSIALDSVSLSHRLVIARPGVRRRLAELLRRRDVDLVHVSLSFSSLDFNLPRLCHELGLPIVATFHVPFDTRMSVWRGISSAVYRLYAQALADCDAVIIFSDIQRLILAGLGVPAERIHVLPNGVDVDRYRPGPSRRRLTSPPSGCSATLDGWTRRRTWTCCWAPSWTPTPRPRSGWSWSAAGSAAAPSSGASATPGSPSPA